MIFAKKKHVLRPVILAIVLTMLAWIPAGMQNCWAEEMNAENSIAQIGKFKLEFDRSTGSIISSSIDEEAAGNDDLAIPETIEGIPVKEIGYGAFDFDGESSNPLAKITLPDSVEFIDAAAFRLCEALTEIVLPSKIKSIEGGTFFYCKNLSEIVLPDGVKTIGDSAFGESGLKKITLSKNLETIERNAFLDCENLYEITIPKSVTTIDAHALGYTNNGLIYIVDKNFTIKGYGTNSAAAKYAEENGFKYIDLEGTVAPAKKKAAPAKVAGLKVKAGKKQMTVSWKKAKNASGYEITYAANKSFKSAAKKVTAKNTANIKKLKSKKTYYVKVRAYNKANGKKQYGKYSSVMRIKIK